MSENNHIEELIVRYFLHDISEEEMCELESWIMESPENKNVFFELKKISDTSRRSVWSENEKEESWQRMYHRINQQGKKPEIRYISPYRRFLYVMNYVAVGFVALFIGWISNEYFFTEEVPETEPVALVYNEVNIEKGGRGSTLVLSDGSRVTLNASTSFRYPSGFSAENRIVYLDGEAYFEVTENKNQPFIVKLQRQDITVLGTSFNVEAYADEAHSVVTLLTGSLCLDSYNDAGESMSKMFIKPNQRAVSDNRSGSVSLEDIDNSLAEAWTEGKYKFKDESLSMIARRLEKYYDVKVHIEGESLKQMRYTGTFSLKQDIQEVLNVMDQAKRYSVRRKDKDIFIDKR